MENDIFMADQIKNENLVVILQCNFFEIDQLFEEITEELAFLPICNNSLINVVLRRFIAQNIKNIIICVKNLEIQRVFEERITDKIKKFLDINFIVASDYNETMRIIDDSDFLYETFVMLNVNTLINLEYKKFIKNYLESKKSDKNIILQCLIPKTNNKNEKVLYGIKNESQIIFYQNFYMQHELNEHFYAQIFENNDICYKSKLGKPKVYVFGKEVLALFNENFDLSSIEDLIESLQQANFYDYKIIKYDYNYKVNDFESVKDSFIIEIDTVKNYYEANKYFAKLLQKNNTSIGFIKTKDYIHNINSYIANNVTIDKDACVENCFIDKNCKISGNITDCILFRNSVVNQDLKNKIVCKGSKIIEIPQRNKFVGRIQNKNETKSKKASNFFADVFICLKDNTDDLIANKVEIADVLKQVNLLSIVWNASNDDLIEAFILFLIDYVDENDLDQSTLYITFFFPLLYGRTEDEATQTKLVMQINNGLKFESKRKKSEAMIRISYALIDDGLVTKDVVKNTKVVKDKYFQ